MKAKTRLLKLLVAAAIAGFAANASAGMYKWTDKQGNVHYSQLPPDEGNTTEIAPPPRVAAPAPANSANKSTSKEAASASAAEAEPQLTPEQQEMYKHNCEAAKANLETFKYARRVQKPDGDFIVMDDDNRQKMTQEAEEQIKKFCK